MPGADPESTGWALVAAAREGDSDAFGELYRRYVDGVTRFVRRRVFHRELADDIVSETFTRALANVHRANDQGRDVAAWLLTIASNLIKDHLKSARHQRERLVDWVADRPCPQTAPDARLLHAATVSEVFDALATLSPERRRCLELRFLRGLTVSETAELTGQSESAVKVMTHRAVRELGRRIAEQARHEAAAA